jgi:hypothetical protein
MSRNVIGCLKMSPSGWMVIYKQTFTLRILSAGIFRKENERS